MKSNPLEPSLSARLRQLTDELSQAIKWNSACLLLGIYRSEFIKDQAAEFIRQFAGENGQTVKEFRVTKNENDVLLVLKSLPQAGILNYISGLQWGGGRYGANAFHALNIHREYLVENGMRCIFWITPTELKKMTRFAPDFWAFRHKVVDFPDLLSPPGINGEESGDMNWVQEIDRYQELLKKRPNDIALRNKLAELLASLGCHEEAVIQYKKTIRLAEDGTGLWLSLAKVYEAMDLEYMARQARRRAAKLKSQSSPGG